MPFDLLSGKFIPEKSNIWRDCVDGYYDWVKEHIMEVGRRLAPTASRGLAAAGGSCRRGGLCTGPSLGLRLAGRRAAPSLPLPNIIPPCIRREIVVELTLRLCDCTIKPTRAPH